MNTKVWCLEDNIMYTLEIAYRNGNILYGREGEHGEHLMSSHIDDVIILEPLNICDNVEKECYRGDILESEDNWYKIDYDAENFRYIAVELFDNYEYDLSDFVVSNDNYGIMLDGKIIGNIYENEDMILEAWEKGVDELC